jgi:hypothetical protein
MVNIIINLAEGNPGTLTFIMEALSSSYAKLYPNFVYSAFIRMQYSHITGSKLYMLWNDCCNRQTNTALDIMLNNSIEDIVQHINYENGRGIEY